MQRYMTPKKPTESRPELLQAIFEEADARQWTGVDLMQHLLTFFTNVDLKLILDGMKEKSSGNPLH